jgi:hypothetical protein
MATTTKKKTDAVKDKLKEETVISEAYLCGLFWNTPEQYLFYPEDKINRKMFFNDIWEFYFGLGKYMKVDKGINVFDEISVAKHIKELGLEAKYERFGGFDAIKEVMEEVEGLEENLDAYYMEIKKYNLLKNLHDLFGDKVLKKTEKYDYKALNKEELLTLWLDKVNQLALDGDAKFEEHYLLSGLKKDIHEWNENPDIGLEFYHSKLMTNICTGWDYGNLYIYGGFGGSGKTSFTFAKVIMSCIANKEKLLIIANEQGIKEFKKLAIATAFGLMKEYFKRQKLNEGGFTEEEIEKLKNAADFLEQMAKGEDGVVNEKLIVFVFMEDYVMSQVKKIVRHYSNRGYKSVLVDTGKPSEDAGSMARWERFTEDFKDLYKMCRPNGGGLNLRMWVNVQLVDTAQGRRFLDENAFGDSKKIKNEASVCFMGRHLWDSEYAGGSDEVSAWMNIPYSEVLEDDPFFEIEYDDNGNPKPYQKKWFKLERYYETEDGKKFPNNYFLLFTPKNRRGTDNKNGQPVLIMRINLNNNTWTEVGWCYIANDRQY